MKDIRPAEAWELVKNGRALFVDIREPEEVQLVRAEQAEPRPLSVAGIGGLPKAAEEMPLVIICRSGRRVRENAELLESLAKGPCFNLEGGMKAWIAAGLPVIQGPKYPLFRQMRMLLGIAAAAGALLSLVFPVFAVLPLAAGLYLIFMRPPRTLELWNILARMPWNARRP